MATKQKYAPKQTPAVMGEKFENAEAAWFWFIQAQGARVDGARIAAGQGAVNRPCEPLDILRVLDGLHRHRRLLRDHLLVLRHYGCRFLPPDPRRVREMRAHELWVEALERIGAVLERKGIIHPKQDFHPFYMEAAE